MRQVLTQNPVLIIQTLAAGMVKRYHESFPSFSYGFDSRYPLQPLLIYRFHHLSISVCLASLA